MNTHVPYVMGPFTSHTLKKKNMNIPNVMNENLTTTEVCVHTSSEPERVSQNEKIRTLPVCILISDSVRCGHTHTHTNTQSTSTAFSDNHEIRTSISVSKT